MIMKGYRTALMAVLGAAVGLAGCQDLDVPNLNNPNRARALATPGDVASLIGSAYRNIYYVQQRWSPGPAQNTMADDHTASWGNFGMKDMSSEPRTAINNSRSYAYAYAIEEPWYFVYGSVVSATDGMRAIEDGLQIGPGGQDTPRTRAFARFIQGLGHAYLALNYDRAFVVDETVDLSGGEAELSSYDQVMQAALGYLQEAIDISSSNSFELPGNWINNRPLTSSEFAAVIHSWMARFMASNPRNESERAAVDWAGVANHVDQGVQSDFSIGGTDWNTDVWWSPLKSYGGEFPIWGRVDLYFIGAADSDSDWLDWLATPVEQRQPFLINTTDRRLTDAGAGAGVVGDPTASGKYMTYYDWIAFNPGRGTYHFSNYNSDRFAHPSTGPDVVEIMTEEMDMLKAEALYRMNGNAPTAEAIALVNATRTANGELPALETDGSVPESGTCVPRMLPDGACGDFWHALMWEKQVETHLESSGISYWDDRGWGELLTGTPIHFPIPALELQVLQREIYTFGGGGEGSAPSIAPVAGGGEEMSIEERIKFDGRQMERMYQAMLYDHWDRVETRQ